MNRRDFLRRLTVGGVMAASAAREWPFRVFSFPQEIKIASPRDFGVLMSDNVRIRFIPALNRLDVLYGFAKLKPDGALWISEEC